MADGVDIRRQRVGAAIRARVGARDRKSDQGELWIDHQCLFHEDAHRSATYQPESGVYHCRACGGGTTFKLEEIERRLSIVSLEDRRPAPSPRPVSPREVASRTTYTYVWPDGRPSHRKDRIEFLELGADQKPLKEFSFRHPEGCTCRSPCPVFGRPDPFWPLYGDYGISPGAYILVVEGEKKVDFVYAMQDSRGAPVVALTAGSTADNKKQAVEIAARLAQVTPQGVILWPDHDSPGMESMDAVARACRKVGLEAVVLKPAEWGLGPKEDVVDYLERGGSLAVVVDKLVQPPAKITRVQETADALIVINPKTFVFPGTRRTAALDLQTMRALWMNLYGRMPVGDQSNELLARLQMKGYLMPTKTYYRLAAYADHFYWRPSSSGACYRVDGSGVSEADDPEDGILVVPEVESLYPVGVDMHGSEADFIEFCRPFNINQLERAMLEGWLVCALCGLQTPILLMRGAAATGKSTFARLIQGIVEPVGIEIDASKQMQSDPREFLRLLQTSPALLLDNVSALGATLEDVLSKLVTGYTTSLRTMYADLVETLRFQKALIITTTNWDVYKGDLASRIIVTQPKTMAGGDRWLSDRDARETFGSQLPRVRGYIFGLCQRFYAGKDAFRGLSTPFRIGDLGLVFTTLGYPVEALAAQESVAKSEVINLNDPWLDCVVALWKEMSPNAPFDLPTGDICDFMRSFGVEDAPSPRSPKLARWMEEKQFIFRDHGFAVSKAKTREIRGYHFSFAGGGELLSESDSPEEAQDGTA